MYPYHPFSLLTLLALMVIACARTKRQLILDQIGLSWLIQPVQHNISQDGEGDHWHTYPVNPYKYILTRKWLVNPFVLFRHLHQSPRKLELLRTLYGK